MTYPSRVQEAKQNGGVIGFLREIKSMWSEYHARCDEAKEYHLPEPDIEFIQEEEFHAGWLLSECYDELLVALEREQAAANHEGDQ